MGSEVSDRVYIFRTDDRSMQEYDGSVCYVLRELEEGEVVRSRAGRAFEVNAHQHNRTDRIVVFADELHAVVRVRG